MYELNTQGLKTQVLGSSAAKYDDRYVLRDINYTDYSKEYRANMLANKGLYRENSSVVYLDGNVVYTSLQKDGFIFKTQHAYYDTNSSIVGSDDSYVLEFNDGVIHGSYLRYNAIQKRVLSKNVQAQYNLQ